MTPRARTDDAAQGPADPGPSVVPASVDSTTLMKGARELVIRHGADTYRLRLTASNKLILTK